MYSQAPLLKLLSAGKVPGESGIPEHIETVISNVFLFEDRVYKVYKNDNDFYNKHFHNISSKKERFAFTVTDFEWNQQFSQEIYLRLQSVKVVSGNIVFVESDEEAEELVQVSKRMPTETILFNRLRKDDLVGSDFFEIGKQFATHEQGFILNGELPNESLLKNMHERYDDLIEWMDNVDAYLPKQERMVYGGQLIKLIDSVYENNTDRLSIGFDSHSFNAFYAEQVLSPFDTCPPKEAWRFCPALVNIYRLATDVFALVGEKEFRAVLRGYNDYLHLAPPPEETERLLIIYASLIMLPYLYMLGKTDPDKHNAAVKYHNFLKHYASGNARVV